MSLDLEQIKNLVNLFNPQRNDEDSDNDDEENSQKVHRHQDISQDNSANIEPKKQNPYDKLDDEAKEKHAEDIYSEEFENFENPELSTPAMNDWKKTPKWDITYRQRVTASDVFLQMGAKTPSTASCEDMIVSVELPGEKMQNMDIKVLETEVEVNSPNFRLKIPLPQPVDPQKGSANWDQSQEKLVITLRMDREFDFINF